jgi:hypothetical protein
MENKSENNEPENQWTAKRIIIRLIAYPFCILLFWGCYHMIVNTDPKHPKQLGLGIIGVLIGGAYIVSDIIMIIKSKKS